MPVRTLASPLTSLRTLVLLSRAFLALGVAMALLLVGEHAGPPAAGDGTVTADIRNVATRTTKVRNALTVAKRQTGDPYRYGAAGPYRFDCSGLIYFSTHRAGFSGVPRTSTAQSRHMRRIKRSNMRPGDFVFFRNGSGVYHAAIYLGVQDGRRRILHAPVSGQRVKRSAIWTNSWFPGTLR